MHRIQNSLKTKLGNLLRRLPIIKEHPRFFNPVTRSDKYLFALKALSRNYMLGKHATIEDFLKILKQYGVRGYNLPNDWWDSFILLANNTNEESSKISSDLVKFTKNLDSQILTVYEWMALYTLCLRTGLFQLGYILRNLAKERAINNLESECKNVKIRKQAIAAALEFQRFDKAFKLFSDQKLKKQYRRQMKWLLNLFLGFPIQNCSFDNDADCEFLDYVSNKSIAVVGPSITDSDDAEEIDSFDRVVRINYTASGKGCDPVYNGTRCDITYFNGEQGKYFISMNNFVIPDDLTWLVFRSLESREKFQKIQDKKISRILINYCKLFFNGSFNMIPNCIFDLLHFTPSKIKVFHADLMLSVRRFPGYYPDSFDYDNEKRMIELFCRGSVSHDPATQYLALQNLWNSKRIEGDERFNEVMQLGCEEYMLQLQNIYGNHVRLGQES